MTTPEDDPYGEHVALPPLRGRKKKSPGARAPDTSRKTDDLDLELARLSTNDIGNAKRLVKRHGHDLFFVPGLNWFAWNGLRWSGDAGADMALQCAQTTAMSIWQEIKALRADDAEDSEDRVDYLSQHAVQSGNMGRLRAMLDAAAPELRCEMELLDADPWLLYAPNDAVRIHPSEMIVERDRAQRVSKITRAEYLAGAVCPNWEKFVAEIFPDETIRGFAQRAAGYSMTGDMSEESFFMCWGKGRNGKGTFLRSIAHALGSYAATIPVELLLEGSQKSGNEPSPQYAALCGVRFAMTTEPSPGARFNEGELKTLTGRDTMRIRDMFGKPFDLIPKFKLWIACNDRPSVRSASDAYWRRVKLIPFVANISEEQTNKRLEEELRAESAGILQWLLIGRADWAERGLAPPDAINSANLSYRTEMDPLHRFLSECVELAPGEQLKAALLWNAYQGWCHENGEDAMKRKSFGISLTNKGYRRRHVDGTVYVDVRLTEQGNSTERKGDSIAASRLAKGLV